MACPTCLAIRAVLEASGMDYETAATLSHSAPVKRLDRKVKKTVKRKASAYAKKYGRAFKKVAKKYKKKNGAWMKNGFKKAQKAAHREAKK